MQWIIRCFISVCFLLFSSFGNLSQDQKILYPDCYSVTGYQVVNKEGIIFGKSGPLEHSICIIETY